MSEETDDPLGVRQLFEEALSGESALSSASAHSPDPWLPVLKAATQVLTDWLQLGTEATRSLNFDHHSACLLLIKQANLTLLPESIVKALSAALFKAACSDAWMANDIIHRVLFHCEGPGATADSRWKTCANDSNSSIYHTDDNLMHLAAMCLINKIKSLHAIQTGPESAIALWKDLLESLPLGGTAVPEALVVWHLAHPRSGSLKTHVLQTVVAVTIAVMPK